MAVMERPDKCGHGNAWGLCGVCAQEKSWTATLNERNAEIRQLKAEMVRNVLVPPDLAADIVKLLAQAVPFPERPQQQKFRMLVELHQSKMEFMRQNKQ